MKQASRAMGLGTLIALLLVAAGRASTAAEAGTPMSFFVTSLGSADRPDDPYTGGDFDGLSGADAFCTELAAAAGAAAGRTWRAYLSTAGEEGVPAVDARDRIGPGPWHNAAGVLVASDVAALHASGIPAALMLDEQGTPIDGEEAHFVLTGASSDGALHPLGANCGDFQVSGDTHYTAVGNALGGGTGQGGIDGSYVAISWNSSTLIRCDEPAAADPVSRGRLYCFSPEGPGGTPVPSATATPSSVPTLPGAPSATPTERVFATPTPTSTATPLPSSTPQTTPPAGPMSFFVSSIGSLDRPDDPYVGGNLGGLDGADALCTELASAAGAAQGRTWRAYLSTSEAAARDRIGAGPWYNAAGALVAADLAALHATGIPADRTLDERGTPVPDAAHDILTGASESGGLHPLGSNCGDFQVSDPTGYTAVGHSDGGGVGQGGLVGDNITVSWNSAHLTRCDEAGLAETQGRGRVYCFSPEGTTSITPAPTSTPSSTPPPSATPSPPPTQPGAPTFTPPPTATRTAPPTRTPTQAPALPLGIALTVRETSGVARTAELVRSGVPMPRVQDLRSPAGLRLLGSDGAAVPARFTVLGRWNAPPADAAAPIRWLLVEFPASVSAGGSAVYTLAAAGAGPALPALDVAETAASITVTTGPARFVVSRSRGSLLDAVFLERNGDGQFDAAEQIGLTAADLGPFVRSGGVEYLGANAAPLSAVVEDAGPGRATVRVEGFHRSGAGAQLLRYVTRLSFFAGQSSVHVHHTIIEGRLDGNGNTDFDQHVRTPLERAGLRLRIGLGGAPAALVTADGAVPSSFPLPSAASAAAVRQRPTSDWRVPLAFEVLQGNTVVSRGQRARQAWLDLVEPRWGLAVATRDFWRKSPQELRATGDGTVEVAFPSEPYAIHQAMGYAEEVLLDFHAAGVPAETLQRRAQGRLKDPLFATAPAAWYTASGALGELSPAPSTRYPRFDEILEEHYQATTAWIDEGHAFGLLNWLDMPVDHFTAPENPDETDWGNSYYNAPGTQIRQFARTADLKWLRDLAFPHIRHWYTTDCYDTDDPAQTFNGISSLHGQYHRGVFTGEYHYMEALWDYYYLTGDRRALERGLAAARSYADGGNWDNDFDLGIGEPGLTTRSISQKLNTMAEAYLASGDAALLATLRADAADTLSANTSPEGFLKFSRSTTNPYFADQSFMTGNLYLPALHKVLELGDDPDLRARSVLLARRLIESYRCTNGNACPGAGIGCSPAVFDFYNTLRVSVGAGGTFTVQPDCSAGNSDDHVYDSGIFGIVAALGRASALGGDTALLDTARQIFEQRGLAQWGGDVFSKDRAEYALRAMPALAYLDTPDPSAAMPPDQSRVIEGSIGAGASSELTMDVEPSAQLEFTFGLDGAARQQGCEVTLAIRRPDQSLLGTFVLRAQPTSLREATTAGRWRFTLSASGACRAAGYRIEVRSRSQIVGAQLGLALGSLLAAALALAAWRKRM